MVVKSIIGAVCACISVASISVNAVVINTLNGIEYEWLEFSETISLSRNQVELRMTNPNDVLYGYEYASRSLTEALFLSYTPNDGLDGYHGLPATTAGLDRFISDFGAAFIGINTGELRSYTTVDGYAVQYEYNNFQWNYALYGEHNECGYELSCLASASVYKNTDDTPVMAWYSQNRGINASYATPTTELNTNRTVEYASLLVRTTAAPIPATVWLFGSGLIGLIGVAKRKNTTIKCRSIAPSSGAV